MASSTQPSAKTIQSLVLHGPHDLRLETRSLPPPSPSEVQISIRTTGLCGSDLHYYHNHRNGDILVREPLSLGHESAGIITAIGSSVTNLAVGDAVALEVGVPCASPDCESCSPTILTSTNHSSSSFSTSNGNGIPSSTPINNSNHTSRYNLCPSMRFRSSAKSFPHYQGTLQQSLNHPAAWVHKLPASVSLSYGALLEPLSVAIHATRRSGLALIPGASVLIFGAGAVGLLCGYMAKRSGASKVLIADIDPGRVSFAVEEGFADGGFVVERQSTKQTTAVGPTTIEEKLALAQETARRITTTTIVPRSSISPSSLSSKQANTASSAAASSAAASSAAASSAAASSAAASSSQDQPHPFGSPNLTFECTGTESCVQTSIYATRPGGKILLVGMGTPVQTLPVSAAALREVDLVGVFRYADCYAEGIEIVSASASNTTDVADTTGTARTAGTADAAADAADATNRNDGNGNDSQSNEQATHDKHLPDLQKLITHRFSGLENARQAFDMAGRTVDDEGRLVLKVLVEMDG